LVDKRTNTATAPASWPAIGTPEQNGAGAPQPPGAAVSADGGAPRPGLAAPCPACDAIEFRVLFQATDRLHRATRDTFEIVECGKCRLIRLEPRPARPAAAGPAPRQAPSATLAGRLEQAYRRLALCDPAYFVRRAIEDAGPPGPVLDVSTDGGLFRRCLRERGTPVIGLDASLEAASASVKAGGAPSVCGSLGSAPVAPESCAAITMLHVLERVEDPLTHVAAAHRLLRPNGRLIVQTPNAACWQFLLLGENWAGLNVPRHLVDFRARELEALLEACGFEVLRRKDFSLLDSPAGLATSLAPGLDPDNRRARGIVESPLKELAKTLLYLALVIAAVPFATLEAACRVGSTVVLEARKRA
jgi:2-polyprenyl-3-methyl-5-hydroxy-6-metoxy-1,4-benzoquinol methylase